MILKESVTYKKRVRLERPGRKKYKWCTEKEKKFGSGGPVDSGLRDVFKLPPPPVH
jgi:hypothetical protein